VDSQPTILWHRIRHGFVAPREPRSPEARVRAWLEALDAIRAELFSRPGATDTVRRFRVPAEYDTLMREVGPGYATNWGPGFAMLGPEQVAGEFSSYYRDFVLSVSPEARPDPDGMWLWFGTGTWSDRNDFFVCCDSGHPLFGAVLWYKDGNPYLNGADGADESYSSLVAFLEWLESRAEPL
jgi:hypothetical protein